jgi:hypothetical protein
MPAAAAAADKQQAVLPVQVAVVLVPVMSLLEQLAQTARHFLVVVEAAALVVHQLAHI